MRCPAVTSEAYLTVGGNKPKVSLGDNATGEYTFSFEVHNFSGAEKRYTLSASLLTEDVTNIGGIDFMAEQAPVPSAAPSPSTRTRWLSPPAALPMSP